MLALFEVTCNVVALGPPRLASLRTVSGLCIVVAAHEFTTPFDPTVLSSRKAPLTSWEAVSVPTTFVFIVVRDSTKAALQEISDAVATTALATTLLDDKTSLALSLPADDTLNVRSRLRYPSSKWCPACVVRSRCTGPAPVCTTCSAGVMAHDWATWIGPGDRKYDGTDATKVPGAAVPTGVMSA